MRSILTLFSFFILLASGAEAQITLTESQHNPNIGDTYEQNINSSPPSSVNAGPMGANVTWDYSSLSASMTAPVNIQESTNNDYPDADIFFSQSGTQSYFGVNSGALTFYGISSSSADVVYTDGEDQVRFPFSYGDSYTDTKAGTSSGFGQTLDISGTVEVTADGYGTLITPEATYNSALRVRIVRTDSSYSNGAFLGETKDSIYYWYVNNFNFPVMTYFRSYDQSGFTGHSINYLTDNTTSLNKQSDSDISFYPNPVKNELRISGTNEKNVKIRIYTSSGKSKAAYNNQKVIPVKELSSGIYFLQIITDDKIMVKKFIKS